MFGQKTDKSDLSLGKVEKVCGYEIKKMPIAPYLSAIQKLENLPADFMEKCFPGMNLQEILDNLTRIDQNGLSTLATNALMATPTYIIGLVADLTGIDKDKLLNDENIGLDGFIDIINAFIEVNRLGEFIHGAHALKAKLKKITTKI